MLPRWFYAFLLVALVLSVVACRNNNPVVPSSYVPSITAFDVSPVAVSVGQPVTLTWKSNARKGYDQCWIESNIGARVGDVDPSGSRTYTPLTAGDYVFTFHAGDATAYTTLRVKP